MAAFTLGCMAFDSGDRTGWGMRPQDVEALLSLISSGVCSVAFAAFWKVCYFDGPGPGTAASPYCNSQLLASNERTLLAKSSYYYQHFKFKVVDRATREQADQGMPPRCCSMTVRMHPYHVCKSQVHVLIKSPPARFNLACLPYASVVASFARLFPSYIKPWQLLKSRKSLSELLSKDLRLVYGNLFLRRNRDLLSIGLVADLFG